MASIVEQRPRTAGTASRLLAVVAGAPLVALLAALPSTAAAHMGSKKSIDVDAHDAGATLHVRVDAVDAALALGLPSTAPSERVLQRGALLGGWLAGGIALRGDGGPCSATADAPAPTTVDGRGAFALRIDYACPAPATNLVLRDETVFAEDPDHETFVAVRGPGGDAGAVLRGETRELPIARTPAAVETAGAFVHEGAIHLVTGYDHLLFLLSLVLSAGLWARRVGLRKALRDVAVVVTAFTLGHSLSLVAAALGWVALPSQLVESAIAASIVLVAALGFARPESHGARPWIAGGFGLVHGFGFSSVLADVGLPTAHRVLALFSFNVGIELAQLAFVALVMLPLVWIAKHRWHSLVMVRAGSLAIAACGCVWLVERGLGL